MNCADGDIACRLDLIATELGRFDWSGLWSSVAATLVSALFAGIVAWLVFRGESRERYEQRLTDAVESLSVALANTAKDSVRWQEDVATYWSEPDSARKALNRPEEPDRVGLDVGLDMLIARAKGSDRITATQIREVAYQLSFVHDARWAQAEYATLRRVIVAWRAGRRTEHETRENLRRVDLRRQKAEKMPHVDDSKLPPAPERHERVSLG